MMTLNRTCFYSILCSVILLFSSSQVFSFTSTEVFSHHLNDVFIETGSYLGDGIQSALDAGFKEVHSIELAPYYYHHCCKRFAGNSHVHLYLGDSSKLLGEVIYNIDQPMTFWLDGHYSEGNTARGETNTPLLQELAIIADHPIKTHTILIDDVRCFGTADFEYLALSEILNMLTGINPDYHIYYENGYQQNDVMVAEVNK